MGDITLNGANPPGNALPLGLAGAERTRGDVEPEPVFERCRALPLPIRGERCSCGCAYVPGPVELEASGGDEVGYTGEPRDACGFG